MTRPDCSPHLDSPHPTYVSNTIWAPLKKSPNWASHSTRLRGLSTDMPYSKPRTASSDRGLLAISRWPGKESIGPKGKQNYTYTILVSPDILYRNNFLLQ